MTALGLGGAFSLVTAYAIVRDTTNGPAAAATFSTLLLVAGVTPVLAPLAGTGILALGSWRAIFVMMAVIGAALTVTVVLVPETRPVITGGDDNGAKAVLTGYRKILTDRVFLGYAVTNALVFGIMFLYITGGPFVLQTGYGLTETQFGVIFAINAAGLIAAAQISGRHLPRVSPNHLILAGVVLALLGGILAGAATLFHLSVWLLLAGFFLIVASVGLVLPQSTALALDRYGYMAGTASATFGGLQYTLAAVAAAASGLEPDSTGRFISVTMICFALAALAVLGTTIRLTNQRRKQ